MGLLNNLFSKRPETIGNYDEFWSWFLKHEQAFRLSVHDQKNIEKDFFDHLSPVLEQLHEGIYFLAGVAGDGMAELVLTPDGVIKNIPFIEDMVAAAPQIPGWRFIALKPAIESDGLEINFENYSFNTGNLHFYARVNPAYPDEIAVILVYDHYNEEEKGLITSGACIFIDNYLGEYVFVTMIDSVDVIGPEDAEEELISIEKLKSYIIWREKEFVEKYEGTRYSMDDDSYSVMEAELEDGKPAVAVINNELLDWDRKPSHQWIMILQLPYNGDDNNGMPDEEIYEQLGEIENAAVEMLKDSEGYLLLGRETSNNTREVFFACKDFRKATKLAEQLALQYRNQIEINFEIFKDKYWQSMERFRAV